MLWGAKWHVRCLDAILEQQNDSEILLRWTKCVRAGWLFWQQSCENMKRKLGCNKSKCSAWNVVLTKNVNLGAIKLTGYKFGNCGRILRYWKQACFIIVPIDVQNPPLFQNSKKKRSRKIPMNWTILCTIFIDQSKLCVSFPVSKKHHIPAKPFIYAQSQRRRQVIYINFGS